MISALRVLRASSSLARVSSEKSAVPCPFASKYTPTSNVSASGWRCLTPVFAHAVANPSVSATYRVDAPLAYAVCTTPTLSAGPGRNDDLPDRP